MNRSPLGGLVGSATIQPLSSDSDKPTDSIVDWEQLSELQHKDPAYRDVISFLESNKPKLLPTSSRAHALKSRSIHYALKEGILYRIWLDRFDEKPRHLVVIPQALQDSVLQSCHDDRAAGHLGFDRTYHRVAERFYWKHMYRDIRRYVAACDICQRRRIVADPLCNRVIVFFGSCLFFIVTYPFFLQNYQSFYSRE